METVNSTTETDDSSFDCLLKNLLYFLNYSPDFFFDFLITISCFWLTHLKIVVIFIWNWCFTKYPVSCASFKFFEEKKTKKNLWWIILQRLFLFIKHCAAEAVNFSQTLLLIPNVRHFSILWDTKAVTCS